MKQGLLIVEDMNHIKVYNIISSDGRNTYNGTPVCYNAIFKVRPKFVSVSKLFTQIITS
jgi:hypothetical protein